MISIVGEVWFPVDGFPAYEVSSLGDVRRSRDGYVLAPVITRDGYRQVCLHRRGKGYSKKVARLVIEAFHGPQPFPGAETRHLDGTRTNDRYDNLRWGSRSRNMLDKAAHGTNPVRSRDTSGRFMRGI